MRVSFFRSAVCAVLALVASVASAQDAKPPPPQFKFEFHGFVGGSVFAQDARFDGFGQSINNVATTPNADRFSFGGDARQTRLNLSISGPTAFGAIPSAVTEFDFLGGAGSGAFANIQVLPRLRLAYAQLKWPSTTLIIGQNSDLIQGGIAPASVGHIATNLGYQHGYLGNRHTGVFVFQTIPFASDYKVELGLQVSRPQWTDVQLDGNTGLSFAESSGLPAVEARVKVLHKVFQAYVAGHWNRVDFSGAGNNDGGSVPCATPSGNNAAASPGGQSGCKNRDVLLVNGGLKINYAGFTAQGNGYVGKNTGVLSGGIGQIQGANVGDLHSWGAWGQLGYDVTKELSLWYLAGMERLQPQEVRDAQAANGFGTNATGAPVAGKWRNVAMSGMIRYMDAGYAIGLEYTHFWTGYVSSPNAASALRSPSGVLEANQYMLSGQYFF